MSELNLYQRINEVRKSIDYIKKDKSVSTGAGSYKAVTHDQVTAMVRDHMVAQGIISYPVLVECSSVPKEEGAKQFRYEAIYDFVFANADKPDESICIRISAHAMDNADKAPGKALSYAKKYAVLKLFDIETGEDDESRYQDNVFDFEFYVNLLNSASSLDELKTAYFEANKEAVKAKDSASLRSLTKLKDELKIKLSDAK